MSYEGQGVVEVGHRFSIYFFTDDGMIFHRANIRRALRIKQLLNEYKTGSEKCVNFDKSTIFFSANVPEEDRNKIVAILGMRISTNAERYLGLPNIVGRNKRQAFMSIKEKFRARIEGWSMRTLSLGGKTVFIRLVLQAITIYSMSCLLMPNSLCREIEQLFAKFWWQKGQGRNGIHLCVWAQLC